MIEYPFGIPTLGIHRKQLFLVSCRPAQFLPVLPAMLDDRLDPGPCAARASGMPTNQRLWLGQGCICIFMYTLYIYIYMFMSNDHVYD